MIREAWFVTFLKVILYTVVAALALRNITTTSGTIAGSLGAMIASLSAPFLVRAKLKPYLVLLSGIILAGLGLVLNHWMLSFESLVDSYGVVGSLRYAELIGIGLTFFGAFFFLRSLALYFPTFAFLEAGVMAGFFIWELAAHRNLSIHRPQYLSDFAWNMGSNPYIVFVAIGALIFIVAMMMMIKTQKFLRATVQVVLIATIAYFLFDYYQHKNIDLLTRENPFGLTGQDRNSPHRGTDNQGNTGGNQSTSGGQGSTGGQTSSGGQGSSGKSNPEEMPFKNSYSEPQDNLPVALVKFGDNYTSPHGAYYLRQTAFSEFNGTRLVQGQGKYADLDILENLPTQGKAPLQNFGQDRPEAHVKVPTQVFWLTGHTKPFGLANPFEMEKITNPNPTYFTEAYTVQSLAPTKNLSDLLNEYLVVPNWSPDKTQYYTDIPHDPRYRELADQILSGLNDEYRDVPMAQVLAVIYYLGQNGFYSLNSDHADEGDPTASFLFGNKTGYCVHFAHAATYLFRSLGIPARVAAGYAIVNQRRGRGEDLVIMEKDAHAWPEVYLEPYGWVIVDIPIQNYLDPPSQEPSPQLQSTLGQIAEQGQNKPKDQIEEQLEEEKKNNKLAAFFKMAWLVLKWTIVVAVIGFLVLSYLFKTVRAWFWKTWQGVKGLRLGYRSTLDKLSYAGIQREFGESREAFAKRIQQKVPAFNDLTWKQLSVKLGGNTQIDNQQVHQMIQQVNSQIHAQSKWYKRWLRAFNPLTWIIIK